MQVFVYEHVTGGGLVGQPLPPSLAREGEMMLAALIRDLYDAGLDVVTTRDNRLERVDLPAQFVGVGDESELVAARSTCLDDSDAMWPVVPELGGALEGVTAEALERGCAVLNSRPSAIRIASSKYGTAKCLAEYGIPTVPTYRFDEPMPARYGRWVLKPDDGVGCLGSYIVNCFEELPHAIAGLDSASGYVAQPFVEGIPASLSLICADGRATLLSCNRQRVAVVNETFCLLACSVNDPEVAGAFATPLAEQIASALPDLWGYVGVDFLLTDEGPRVLEVNPRLTTCYVGLRRSLTNNPAELVLGLLDDANPYGCVSTHRQVEVDLEAPYVG